MLGKQEVSSILVSVGKVHFWHLSQVTDKQHLSALSGNLICSLPIKETSSDTQLSGMLEHNCWAKAYLKQHFSSTPSYGQEWLAWWKHSVESLSSKHGLQHLVAFGNFVPRSQNNLLVCVSSQMGDKLIWNQKMMDSPHQHLALRPNCWLLRHVCAHSGTSDSNGEEHRPHLSKITNCTVRNEHHKA